MKKTYLPQGLPKPALQPDGVDAPFWEAARDHKLVIQRCKDCSTFQVPPEWICYSCHSEHIEWRPVSGRARIFSWMRVWHPAHPALKEAIPYVVVLVELADAQGIRLLGNLLGDPNQEIEIGAEVEAVFEDHDDDYTLIQWRLV